MPRLRRARCYVGKPRERSVSSPYAPPWSVVLVSLMPSALVINIVCVRLSLVGSPALRASARSGTRVPSDHGTGAHPTPPSSDRPSVFTDERSWRFAFLRVRTAWTCQALHEDRGLTAVDFGPISGRPHRHVTHSCREESNAQAPISCGHRRRSSAASCATSREPCGDACSQPTARRGRRELDGELKRSACAPTPGAATSCTTRGADRR